MNKSVFIKNQIESFKKKSITVDGDKSISIRFVLLSSLSSGRCVATNLLESDDVLSAINIVRKLGIKVKIKSKFCEIIGKGLFGLKFKKNLVLDSGNSGTTARLICGMLADSNFWITITGDKSLSARPMSRVTNYLEDIGAKIILTKKNYLPISIQGTQNSLPLKHIITKPSAQIKSSLMLAAINIAGQTTIIEKQATRDHTEIMFKYLGIKFKKKTFKNL